MAINWGVALGSAVNTGLNTYERLGEEELREMQRKELRERIERDAKERTIAGETLGKIGQETEYGQAVATEGKTNAAHGKAISDLYRTGDPEFDRIANERDAAIMRENAARQGVPGAEAPMKPLTPQKYTEDQAYADYARKMAIVDPKAARQARVEGLQIKDLARRDRQAEVLEQAGKDMGSFMKEANEFAKVNGIPAAVAKYGFGIPGVNISIDKDKNGEAVVNVLGKDKKITKTIPLTMENYADYIGQLAEKRFLDTVSAANPEYYFKGRQLRNEDRKTDIEEGFKGPGGVYERVHMADAAAKQNMYAARATPIGVSKNNQLIMSDGTTRPMPEGTTKEDFFPKTSGIKNEWAEYEKTLTGLSLKEKAEEQVGFYARRNAVTPGEQTQIESGYYRGKKLSPQEVDEAIRRYPGTPWNIKPSGATEASAAPAAPAAPQSALPASRPVYTPPADSKAAKLVASRAAEREKAKASRAAEQEKMEAPARAAQAEFNKDVATLAPLALVQKYDRQRGLLNREQLVKLKQAEQQF